MFAELAVREIASVVKGTTRATRNNPEFSGKSNLFWLAADARSGRLHYAKAMNTSRVPGLLETEEACRDPAPAL